MQYILFFILLSIMVPSHASDYAIGCGTQSALQAQDLFFTYAKKNHASMLGARCQLIVSTAPQSNKWLPAMPNISVSVLDNDFFNSFDEQSSHHNLDIHWPIYRSREHETGLYIEYNKQRLPFTLSKPNLNHWRDNQLAGNQQQFKHQSLGLATYLFIPDANIINEVGLGVNRLRTTGILNQPSYSNDALANIDSYDWFLYMQHRTQNLGWDMPFKGSLHYGRYWNNKNHTQSVEDDLVGMNLEFGLSYSYRIDYKWTIRLMAKQRIQARFNSIRTQQHYNKSRFSLQGLGEISAYYHF